MNALSRRNFVLEGLSGCALCALSLPAFARIRPASMQPLVGLGYQPTDLDERGLWQACEELERELASSNFLIDDPVLKNYVRGVTDRVLGKAAADMRVYVVRDPDFNAAMAPNGMMIVHTGLLARMRDEAQLAAVIGHEGGHYLRRHSLQTWRTVKSRTALMSSINIAGVAAIGAAARWYGLATAINASLVLTLFSYSRGHEREADAFGLKLMQEAGYPLRAAPHVWSQLIAERKASAAMRRKRYRDHSNSVLSTHPPTAERLRDLSDSAEEMTTDAGAGARRAEWLAATRASRVMLIDEQIKLNDPGASLYLLNSLAQDGWDDVLRYYEGETYRLRDDEGDKTRAAEAYAAALQYPNALAPAWRAHGYAQLKAGHHAIGREALARYLELSPGAVDAEMVRVVLKK